MRKGKENQTGGGRDGEADRAGKATEKRAANRTGGRKRRTTGRAEAGDRWGCGLLVFVCAVAIPATVFPSCLCGLSAVERFSG